MAINFKFWEKTKVVYKQATLPFVTLFGYEKSYGAAQPNDFSKFINSFHSWPYACIMRNAFSIAKCNLRLYSKDKNKTEIETHPFLNLIQTVNPFTNRFELWLMTMIFLELTGNAYWWLPKSPLRIPEMIWSIPSHWIKIVPSKTEFISGYVMQVPNQGKPIPFDADEIIHFKYPSPFNLFYGTGPLFAASYGIDLNAEIKKWGINYFINNAQPGGILFTDDHIQEGAYQRLKDEWNNKHKGTENAGKIAILTNGLKYQQTGSSLKDAKFEGVSRDIRDEILAIFGVPASKLGLVEDVNRANADANDYTYQKETILPRLLLIEEKLNEKLMPLYDINLVVKFDNPVPEDKEYRLRERTEHIHSGYSSIDDERIKDNEEPYNLPETQTPLIPFSLTPAGQEKPGPVIPAEEESKQKAIGDKKRQRKWETFVMITAPQEKHTTELMRTYFQEQHSEVMRNLASYRNVNSAITKGIDAYILFNMNEANTKLKNKIKSAVRQSYINGLTLGMQDAGATIDWNLYEVNIIRAVENRLSSAIGKINTSTANLIKDQIIAGVEKGETIEDIARRVDTVYQHSEHYRSVRIAQTETIGATNEGQLAAYREAKFEFKEWITARDEKVRESHQQLEGRVVKENASFVTGLGGHLQYPGDRGSDALPEDVINCRCTIIPSKKAEGDY